MVRDAPSGIWWAVAYHREENQETRDKARRQDAMTRAKGNQTAQGSVIVLDMGIEFPNFDTRVRRAKQHCRIVHETHTHSQHIQ